MRQISSILFILSSAVFLAASVCSSSALAEGEKELFVENPSSTSATVRKTVIYNEETLLPLLAAGEDKSDAGHSASPSAKRNANQASATVASSSKVSTSKSESAAVTKNAADSVKSVKETAKSAADSAKSTKETAKGAADSVKTTKEAVKGAPDPAKSLKDAIKGAADSTKSPKDAAKGAADSGKSSRDGAKASVDSEKTSKDAAKGSSASGKSLKDSGKSSKEADKTSKDKSGKDSAKSTHEHKNGGESIRPRLVPPPPPSVPTMSEMPGMGGPTMIFMGENLDYMPAADLRELKTKTERDILRAKEKLEDLTSAAAEKQQKAVSFDQLFAEGVISRRELEASKHDDVRADQDLADAKQALSMLEQKRNKIDQRLESLNKPKKSSKQVVKKSHH